MSDKKTLDLSIIIPFKNHSDLTIACLASIKQYANPVKEILIVSNNSSDEELQAVKAFAKVLENAKVIVYNHPFNFQTLNNWAIKQAIGKVVLLLNNDIVLTDNSKDIFSAMYIKSVEKTTGAVGCTLLYEDRKTIQHAGVYLVPGGTADHLYIGKKLKTIIDDTGSRFDITKSLRVSAVTAAALMVEKNKFDQIGGMDNNFIVCGGDVDLCLRLGEHGYENYVIGTQHGTMIHKESRTRSVSNVPYVDFCESYKSYVKHFNINTGDVYLPWKEVTEN